MANPYPVIAICIAAVATSFGAAFLASAAPNEDRACPIDEFRAERVFAVEGTGAEGARQASYYVELANLQARPQVFTLRFEADNVQEAPTGARATSLGGRQTMPMMLGSQELLEGEKPMSPDAITQAMRLNCRNW